MLLSGSGSLFVTQKPRQKKPQKPSPVWLPCPDTVLSLVRHICQAAEFWGFFNIAWEGVVVME